MVHGAYPVQGAISALLRTNYTSTIISSGGIRSRRRLWERQADGPSPRAKEKGHAASRLGKRPSQRACMLLGTHLPTCTDGPMARFQSGLPVADLVVVASGAGGLRWTKWEDRK